jgi:hypothetical protein
MFNLKKIGWIVIGAIFVMLGLTLTNINLRAGWLDFFYTSKDVLTVDGNKILFNKQAVWLKGVAVGDPHSRVVNDRRTIDDYRLIKEDWLANTVRLSVHPGVFKNDHGRMEKILDKEVQAARQNGLFVIIDWHVIGLPNGWYKNNNLDDKDNYYSYDSNFNTATDFWKEMAAKFRGDRGVMFELWNEPADPKKNNWSDIKPYLDRLYDIIRGQGANNLIIAPGAWWDYDLRGIKNNALKGDNIAYAWHNYASNTRYLSWNKALDGLSEKYPVIVTEWGYDTDSDSNYYQKDETYANNLKQFIYDNGLHFTAWCWHASWRPKMFESNWLDLNGFGKFVKIFLAEFDQVKQSGITDNPPAADSRFNDFIERGADVNSISLGRGERSAVVYSFTKAFNRSPQSQADYDDILRIASGLCPKQKSLKAEKSALEIFEKIYLRPARLSDKNDYMAVMIMAYGLRQKAENRNLNSEFHGMNIYNLIFNKLPRTAEEWNILQAITYSGAKR